MPQATYPPLDTLKPVAPDLWVVDGPVIRFGMLKMPFPTRMTVVRLAGGDLFIHSPTRLAPALRAETESIGRVRWIVGPNRLHHWWIPDWKGAFGPAEVYLAPGIETQAGGRIAFPFQRLERTEGYPWDRELATAALAGGFMTEFAFFHRASRTLILTDGIENFEPGKLSAPMRWLCRLGGVLAPDGGMPRDLRLTFARRKPDLRAAVAQMLAWEPERVIFAHGRWYESDGARRLRRAFGWLLRG